MADTGKIVTKGLHASAIKYVVLKGLTPTGPTGPSINACFITKGLGKQTRERPVLHGMSTNPSAGGGGGGAFWIFGDAVIL